MLNLKMYQDQKGKLGKIWLWRNYVVTMNKFKQGDIVWANFSPSVGQEMKGKHPAVVVSSNSYNEKTNYLMVCPITSHGKHLPTYLDLFGYYIPGRLRVSQFASFSIVSLVVE